MRHSIVAAVVLLLAGALPVVAEPPKEKPPLEMVQPATTPACLELLEMVTERAEDADMLDDQAEAAEAELEVMEAHCEEKRFAEALDSAKTVMKLVEANK